MKPPANGFPRKWAWHHRALLRLRTALMASHQEHDRAARVPHERGGADAVDFAEDEVELVTLRAKLALEEIELGEIEAALQRLQSGTYGVCAATGLPISEARLRALPWTRYSKAAAVRRELTAQAAPVRRRRGR
ncbi:MAG: TraR/DksA family transcriptional regulator [Verrucomicrobia bacterium]|nr:TraR/DksA family transcriptional regulator [Verrucomicrobiota bacterium]